MTSSAPASLAAVAGCLVLLLAAIASAASAESPLWQPARWDNFQSIDSERAAAEPVVAELRSERRSGHWPFPMRLRRVAQATRLRRLAAELRAAIDAADTIDEDAEADVEEPAAGGPRIDQPGSYRRRLSKRCRIGRLSCPIG
ncbi:hypothetical protein BOX15_Mlig011401g2 [Macrostomum lignano]|uniref:Secreted protein n=2 Tax=Macrostomum lignano TaxID=282301 RepID=A0A1I8JHF7_9PLAT|nr:hypothetical protein BOX15_Mlig011401g2 [Macrostomum lignano]